MTEIHHKNVNEIVVALSNYACFYSLFSRQCNLASVIKDKV